MHELSVALEVCRLAEEELGLERLADVRSLAVRVGRESCVERANLEFCLGALLSSPPFECAKAVVRSAPGRDVKLAWMEVDDAAA